MTGTAPEPVAHPAPRQEEPLVYQAARQEADKILASFGDTLTFPVDLGVVSNLMYARMRLDNQMDDMSGMIVKNPGMPAEILINSYDHPTRRRFTWAHELGHLAERTTVARDFEYSFVDWRSTSGVRNYTVHEFYADEFAGALLMPAFKVKELKEQGKSTVEMARFFGVSPAAMDMRLHRLSVDPEQGR